MPTVTCARCKSQISLTHDQLRELTDQDRQPTCRTRCAPSEPTAPGQLPEIKVTAKDYLILALDLFERGGRPLIPRSSLVLAVWKMAPHVFGLSAFEAVAPDSKRVDNEIFQLVDKKLALRPHPNTLRLSAAGLDHVAYLRNHAKGTMAKATAAFQAEVEAKRI